MYRFFDMGLEAGVAAVILVPLFLVVNRIYFHDLGRTVGTVLGYLLARVVLKLFPGTEPSARTKDVFLVCGMTFGVMFFVQPFLAALVWNWIM